MKTKSYSLDIPTPCHEKWSDMHKRQNGRFCNSCQKTVIDFSQMSDREVAAIFNKADDNLCGKFRNDQLNRPVHFEQPKSLRRTWSAFGLLVPGLFLSSNIQAQELNRKVEIEQQDKNTFNGASQKIELSKTVTIKGTVKDAETDEVLIGANVLVKGTSNGTVTSIDGSYSIDATVPESCKSIILVFNYTGFQSYEMEIKIESPQTLYGDAHMSLGAFLLGEIVVIRDQTLYSIIRNQIRNIAYNVKSFIKEKKNEKKEKIKSDETHDVFIEENSTTKILNNKPIANPYQAKIFPNPFSSELNVEINMLQNETLEIHLLDFNGRIIFTEKYDAVKGRNNILITPQINHLSGGNYFLEIIGGEGLYFSEMVVYTDGR